MRDSVPHPHETVYAPSLDEPEPGGVSRLTYGLILAVVAAGGGFVYLTTAFRAGPAPLVTADGPYREAPPPELAAAPSAPELSVFDLMEGRAPAEPSAGSAPEVASGAPAQGAWTVQLAALRSDAAAREAWARLQAGDPELFAQAGMEVDRADLGGQGVYFRLRAGPFASQREASRFCARLRQSGRDCLVVAR